MLNDDEQKVLSDVERSLVADDPELARSFEEQLDEPTSLPPEIGSTGKATIRVALLLSAVLLLAGFAGAAVALAATTGLLWVMWRVGDGPTDESDGSSG